MSRDEFVATYWKYYLILEQHFEESEKYVEFSVDNYATYSMQFISCLMETGAELDGVMKSICGFSPDDRKTIQDYAPKILGKYPDINTKEVIVRGNAIMPFKGWTITQPAQSLEWWKAYNSVKHGRSNNYKKANLKNVLYALAALFLLEMYRIQELADDSKEEMDIPDKASKLFVAKSWEQKYVPFGCLMGKIDGKIEVN